METKTGTITTIFWKRHFGFIRSEEGEDLFFSESGVIKPLNFRELREGYEVEFLRVEDPNGKPKAIGVVVR